MQLSFIRYLVVAAAVLLLPGLARAQDFPSKPIKLVVPFPPGGPNDVIARVVAQKMSEILKQPFVIDNRSGAGGVLGTDAVAKSAPDGYTLAVTSAGALAISPSLPEKMPYDTLKDLTPVSLVASVPELLVVGTEVPAKDLGELIALAKTKPGKLNFASSGPGSMPHLAGELLKLNGKIDIVHVPYRGAAPAVNDLIGNQVQMAFFDLPVLLPQVQGGKVKAIAVGSKARAPNLKDVPTTAEAGFPQIEAENWYGMVAPAGTPPAVVEKLHKALVAAVHDKDVADKLSVQGAVLIGNTPAEFTAYIKSETAKWASVAKAAGLSAN